jgi:hypothetical protein
MGSAFQVNVEGARPNIIPLLLAERWRGEKDESEQEGRKELGFSHVFTPPKAPIGRWL